MRFRTALSKLRRRTGAERKMLLAAFFWLTLTRIAIAIVPFERIARWIHLTPGEDTASNLAPLAETIGWAVQVAASRTPWTSTCLAQALAGTVLLRQQQLPGTLYLGVKKNRLNQVDAHAWLRSGDRVLTGNQNLQQYAVVGKFSISR